MHFKKNRDTYVKHFQITILDIPFPLPIQIFIHASKMWSHFIFNSVMQDPHKVVYKIINFATVSCWPHDSRWLTTSKDCIFQPHSSPFIRHFSNRAMSKDIYTNTKTNNNLFCPTFHQSSAEQSGCQALYNLEGRNQSLMLNAAIWTRAPLMPLGQWMRI